MAGQDWFEKDFYAVLGRRARGRADARSRRRTASWPGSTTRTPTPVTRPPSGGSRRSARPTRCSPTPSSGSSTTPSGRWPAAAPGSPPVAPTGRRAGSRTCSAGSSAAGAGGRGGGATSGSPRTGGAGPARTSRTCSAMFGGRRPDGRPGGYPGAVSGAGRTPRPRPGPRRRGDADVPAGARGRPAEPARRRPADRPADGHRPRARRACATARRSGCAARATPATRGPPDGDLVVTVHVAAAPGVRARRRATSGSPCPSPSPRPRSAPRSRCRRSDGGTVRVRVPAGTPSGRTLRVKGRGRRQNGKQPGDLLVTVQVAVPQRLDGDGARRRSRPSRRRPRARTRARDLLARAQRRRRGSRRWPLRSGRRACRVDVGFSVDETHPGLRDLRRRAARGDAPADAAAVRPARAWSRPAGRRAAAGATRRATSRCCARCSGCRQDEGVNLAGIKRILELQVENDRLRDEVTDLEATLAGRAAGRRRAPVPAGGPSRSAAAPCCARRFAACAGQHPRPGLRGRRVRHRDAPARLSPQPEPARAAGRPALGRPRPCRTTSAAPVRMTARRGLPLTHFETLNWHR